VKAESAFLDHAVHPVRKRPDTLSGALRGRVGAVVLFIVRLFIVETPGSVRAGDDAVLAADTPPEVLYHDSILATIGGLGRAYRYTRGIVAVHTWHWYQVDS